jgi:DNA-binding IscR family transcriptional regulator
MTKVRDAISEVLDRMTIADMVAIGEGSNVAPMVRQGRTLQNRKRARGSGRSLAGSNG